MNLLEPSTLLALDESPVSSGLVSSLYRRAPSFAPESERQIEARLDRVLQRLCATYGSVEVRRRIRASGLADDRLKAKLVLLALTGKEVSGPHGP